MIEGFSKIVERSISRIDIGHLRPSVLLILRDRFGKVKTLSNLLQHFEIQVNPLNPQTTNLPISQTTKRPTPQTTNLPNSQTTKQPTPQTTKQPNDQTTNRPNDQLAKDGSQVGNRINNGRKKEEILIEEYPEINLAEIVEQMIQKRILPPRLRTQHCCCIVKAFALYFNSNVWGKLTLFSRLLKEGLKDAVACGVRALQKCFSDFGFFGHQKTEVNDCWEKHRQEKYDGMNRLINTIKAFLSENMSFVMP